MFVINNLVICFFFQVMLLNSPVFMPAVPDPLLGGFLA